MVKTQDQVKKVIQNYIVQISKDYRVTGVILFGSYAKGNAKEESDIDLAVISPDFSGESEMEILQYLSRKALDVDTRLEVLAFTPDEMLKPDPRTFTYQIKTYGIPIAA